jgi:ABC-2 type transport system permease protein
MNGRRVAAITIRILQQFRRDHRTLALLFVAPLIILTLFYLLLRGGSSSPAVDVVVEDTGPLGQAIASHLDSSSHVRAHRTSLSTAQDDLAHGGIAAYIRFPSDFSQAAVTQHAVTPEVDLEGTQPGLDQPVMLAVQEALVATASSIPGVQAAPKLSVDVHYLHGGNGLDTLDYFGGAFIGLVVFFLVFVITIVSFLRERSQGTLERLMASPLRRGEIVVGYMAGFSAVALIQSIEVVAFSVYVLHIYNSGNIVLIFGLTILMAVMAVNLGIFLSMFARTEFQAVQFIPLVIVPQVLLSGVVFPITTEPSWLQYLSNVLPLTYAVNGLRDIMLKGSGLDAASVQLDTAVVVGFTLVLVAAGATTLRRRIA